MINEKKKQRKLSRTQIISMASIALTVWKCAYIKLHLHPPNSVNIVPFAFESDLIDWKMWHNQF